MTASSRPAGPAGGLALITSAGLAAGEKTSLTTSATRSGQSWPTPRRPSSTRSTHNRRPALAGALGRGQYGCRCPRSDGGHRMASRVAPVVRSKAAARATYDRRSRSYERIEGRFERNARVTGEQLLAVKRRESVVEIGSGPGASLTAFARETGADGLVVGLDIASQMHRVAADHLRDDRLAAAVRRIVADGAHIPLRSRSVDAAFASFTLELFDTPELLPVLSELRRVLRPGGRVAIVSLTTTDPPALMERAYLAAHGLMPRLADCRPIPVTSLLTEAGFEMADQRRRDILGIPVIAALALAPAS